MKIPLNHVTACLLALSLAACSSSDEVAAPDAVDSPATAPGAGPNAEDDGSAIAPPAVPGDTADTDEDLDTPSADMPDDTPDPGTPLEPIGLEPINVDTVTGPLPAPPDDDLFFTSFDFDADLAVAGSPPTTPKNLRIDLVSNDWAEFSWAPSNDDGEVVEYRVHRIEDGHVYRIRGDQDDPESGTRRELDRYWKTTSFIDCNYTRFAGRIHDCASNGPKPGDVYSYEISAVDDAGLESGRSNRITIRYHDTAGSAVSTIDDPYGDATFAQGTDLSTDEDILDNFQLVFEDEFDQGSLNEDFWNTELIWGDATIINGEQQFFVSGDKVATLGHDPFVFSDSTLTLEAIPTPATVRERARSENVLPSGCLEIDPAYGTERCAFLSGALSSHDKFNFLYGYVEGRMKASGGAGALSSFYLYHRYAGEGRSFHAPEIDILEYLGENPFVQDGGEDAFQNYHYGDTSLFVRTGEAVTRTSPTMSHAAEEGNGFYAQDFHTYGVLWEPQLIVWYIDGREVRRLSGPQVSRQPMNIVTYLVSGSGWAPMPDTSDPDLFPLRYEIDWIRAWQRPPYVENGVVPAQD